MTNVPPTGWSRSKSRPARLSSFNLPLPPLLAAMAHYDHTMRRRFHVPAHAGQALLPPDWDVLQAPYHYDQTEVEGLDVLSEPSGCLKASQEQVASIFGVRESFFLLNGASVGLAAAMLSVAGPGDAVLLPRNVHRSVLSGVILSGARPVWMLPEALTDWGIWGDVPVAVVQALLEAHPEIRALFITSPTYEGLGSDVAGLVALCRAYDVRLVVDEAHGGLWPFSAQLPQSACGWPVDVVVHSMHKTGGSLTQTALAHLPNGSRVDGAVFQQALNTLQTTSPSYVLMANLEATCHWLAGPGGQDQIQAWRQRVDDVRTALGEHLIDLRLFEPAGALRDRWDPSRLYVQHKKVSADYWAPWLELKPHGVAYEAATSDGALYVAPLGLPQEDFDALVAQMLALEQHVRAEPASFPLRADVFCSLPALPDVVCTPREAFFGAGQSVLPAQAVGRIAKETVVHCPPGIPVLMPGERIQAEHVPLLPPQGVQVMA